MERFRFQSGETPVLLVLPHVGTCDAKEIALAVASPSPLRTGTQTVDAGWIDNDWYLDRLLHFAPALGAGFLTGTLPRYVTDLDQMPAASAPSDGGQACPENGPAPGRHRGNEADGATKQPSADYWRAFHDRLNRELMAIHDRFGIAVLLVAQTLPGGSGDIGLRADRAAPALPRRLNAVISASTEFTRASSGLGDGVLTSRYGAPDRNVHAVRLGVNRSAFLDDEAERRFRNDRAARLRPLLERLIIACTDWAWEHAPGRRYRFGY